MRNRRARIRTGGRQTEHRNPAARTKPPVPAGTDRQTNRSLSIPIPIPIDRTERQRTSDEKTRARWHGTDRDRLIDPACEGAGLPHST